MSRQSTYQKDPSAVLDWIFDWSTWLATGETITARTVTVATGLTKDSDAITDASKKVTVWLSGGTAGQSYTVACAITTSSARIDERTITIRVDHR